MQPKSFHEAYRSLLTATLNHGFVETNERTGKRIRALSGGHSFKIDLTTGKLPVAGNRRFFPHVAAAETAWQIMGTQSPDWILKMAPKIWQDFVEDGKIKTAYGYRWRKHFGRDQLALAIEQLAENPTNRQLYISAWDPRCDGLGEPGQPKNIPCPVGFSVSRLNDDLHMSLFIRSSDIFVGLPYDIMSYALTLDMMAASVGGRPASLHVTLAHPHLYEAHWSMTKACLETDAVREGNCKGASSSWCSDCEPNLPAWTLRDIEFEPEGYVNQVKRLAARVRNNSWNPMPEVIL